MRQDATQESPPGGICTIAPEFQLLARLALRALGATALCIHRVAAGTGERLLCAEGHQAADLLASWPPAAPVVGVEVPLGDLCIRAAAVGEPHGSPGQPSVAPDMLRDVAHLAAAMTARADGLADADARLRAAVLALDQLSVGVVLVDPRGGTTANRAAREILRPRAPALLLPEAGPQQWGRWLADRWRLPAQTSQDACVPSDLVVLASPPGNGSDDGVGVVYIADPQAPFARFTDLMRRQYGLTRLEAQLVSLLVDGDNLAEIAVKMRVSIHTVRAYLKRIFVKTGVNRQSTLVGLMLRGVGQVCPDTPLQAAAMAIPRERRRKAAPPSPPAEAPKGPPLLSAGLLAAC